MTVPELVQEFPVQIDSVEQCVTVPELLKEFPVKIDLASNVWVVQESSYDHHEAPEVNSVMGIPMGSQKL